jgi:hypothetical protein
MAEQACCWNRPGKIGVGIQFVTWSHAPGSALGVVTKRRLEKMVADANQISQSMTARADYIGDALLCIFAVADESLVKSVRVLIGPKGRSRI